MISVRLPEELEKKLNQLAESENVTKTYLVKEALNKYIAEKEEKKDSYQLGKDLFGKHGSGKGDLSTTYRKRVSDRVKVCSKTSGACLEERENGIEL